MNVARDTGAPSAQIRSPGPAAGRVIAGERLYYSEPEGGVDLGGQAPDYTDFAYLALTIGMTFQVSDTALTARRVRRVALHHALLSYLYGAVIVVIMVNSLGGLLGH